MRTTTITVTIMTTLILVTRTVKQGGVEDEGWSQKQEPDNIYFAPSNNNNNRCGFRVWHASLSGRVSIVFGMGLLAIINNYNRDLLRFGRVSMGLSRDHNIITSWHDPMTSSCHWHRTSWHHVIICPAEGHLTIPHTNNSTVARPSYHDSVTSSFSRQGTICSSSPLNPKP